MTIELWVQLAQTFGVPFATCVAILYAWNRRIFVSRAEHEAALQAERETRTAIIAEKDTFIKQLRDEKAEEIARTEWWRDAWLKTVELAESEQQINRQTLPLRGGNVRRATRGEGGRT